MGGWEILSRECVRLRLALLSGTIELLEVFLRRFLTEKVLRNDPGSVPGSGVRLCEDWLLLSRRGFQEFGKALLITLLDSSSDISMPVLWIYSCICVILLYYYSHVFIAIKIIFNPTCLGGLWDY